MVRYQYHDLVFFCLQVTVLWKRERHILVRMNWNKLEPESDDSDAGVLFAELLMMLRGCPEMRQRHIESMHALSQRQRGTDATLLHSSRTDAILTESGRVRYRRSRRGSNWFAPGFCFTWEWIESQNVRNTFWRSHSAKPRGKIDRLLQQ